MLLVASVPGMQQASEHTFDPSDKKSDNRDEASRRDLAVAQLALIGNGVPINQSVPNLG